MNLLEKCGIWLKERIPFIGNLKEFLQTKQVPRHRYSFFYLFGGLSLLLFFVQLVTGALLALYYSPTPDTANESVRSIMSEVEYGWLVRSVHSWGSNLMVALVLVHMFSTYFMRAYRKPREAMWISGVIVLLLVLGFAFTGYLLPWDTTAYFATQIGTEIPKSIPVIGETIVMLLRGATEVGEETLRRSFTIHTIILPVISLLIMGFHVSLQQVLGTSIPENVVEKKPGLPFFPNYMYRDLFAWTVLILVLIGLAALLPTELGSKANPFASAPIGIKPEWYFLPLYQTLRIVPMTVFTLNGEMIVNVLTILGLCLWLAVPLIDKGGDARKRIFRILGVVVLVYYCVAIVLAYTT